VGVNVGSCGISRLLCADKYGTACLHLVNRAFNMHFVGFQLRAIKLVYKFALKRPRYYASAQILKIVP